MLHTPKHFLSFLPLLAVILLVACSAERKNVISKAYHNTTARYNAYFYALQRIEEIKEVVNENFDDDYSNILKIYPTLDSTQAASYQTQVDDCIKKASLAIQHHKNSKWVDDSYVLIGRARYYSMDFVNAIATYKYVNTTSKDPAARHEALARLLRTFTDAGEYSNTIAVSDFMKKEKLSKQNARLLYLNRAHYYQIREDYNNVVKNLVQAVPLMKKRDGRSRMYFIIGQIYQSLGFESEAYNNYKKCIADSPPYELDFYARLYLAQVTELDKNKDVKATRKTFQQLLDDKKNKEFRDKIYYEMGTFELKQANITNAISYFKASVQASSTNNRQKGRSYLKLGEVYYDSLHNYELAKAYYDSTITALPTDYDHYDDIKARQQVLSNFVTQRNTIALQDSLLRLSEMNRDSVKAKLKAYVITKKKKQTEVESKDKKKQKNYTPNITNSDNTGIGGTSWYFGNPSAVALGQAEFKRIWGDRPLADNWRLSSRIGAGSSITTITQQNIEKKPEETSTQKALNESAEVESMYAAIPFGIKDKEAAMMQVEAAYYQLGNIYYFDLREEHNAVAAFETLLRRFPDTEHEPEVLYHLYLISSNLGDKDREEKYKQVLISKYPNTTYAKLLINPNYTAENTAANEQLKNIYKTAYGQYKDQQYTQALNTLDKALTEYQETIFTPRLKLLKILIIGETKDVNLYQYELDNFIKKNPDSDITPYAQELLDASKAFQEKRKKLLGTAYIKSFQKTHYFIVVYDAKTSPTTSITNAIETFNTTAYPNDTLTTATLSLNDNLSVVMVSDFKDKNSALKYFRKFQSSSIIPPEQQSIKLYKFVITEDNFTIFYQSKDPKTYLDFFDKHYNNGS